MTTSHKLTLFNLVLARLTPYRKRLQHKCQLKIQFTSWHNFDDCIEISLMRFGDDSHITQYDWLTYKLDVPSERNINSFIDEAVEKIKPFIH